MIPKRDSIYACLIVMLAVFITAGSLKAQQGPNGVKLPFRAKQDGSVDFRDLLELTKQAPAKDRITDVELQVIKDRHKVNYGRGFKATDEAVMPARGDYYSNSTLLTDGTNHTVLPNHAIIHLPKKYQDRRIEKPSGKLVLWPDFLKANSRWIRTEEVTLETALGEDPLTEEKLDFLKSTGFVIVGVLRGSPISVLPPGESEDSLTSTQEPEEALDTAPAPPAAAVSRYRIKRNTN